jgi:hypothetical protein
MTMSSTDSHCRQWVARNDNEGAFVAMITSGSTTQGRASTTLDTETRQVQDDDGRQNATSIAFMLDRTQSNMPGQGSKEVGIYVPAGVDDKDNAI